MTAPTPSRINLWQSHPFIPHFLVIQINRDCHTDYIQHQKNLVIFPLGSFDYVTDISSSTRYFRFNWESSQPCCWPYVKWLPLISSMEDYSFTSGINEWPREQTWHLVSWWAYPLTYHIDSRVHSTIFCRICEQPACWSAALSVTLTALWVRIDLLFYVTFKYLLFYNTSALEECIACYLDIGCFFNIISKCHSERCSPLCFSTQMCSPWCSKELSFFHYSRS